MKKLYKFHWDCGRQGSLDGLFIAEEDEVKKAIGRQVYFGEVLGKHSEVYGTLDKGDIKVIADDPEKVEWLEAIMDSGTISGRNPLHYIRVDCYNCEDPLLEDGCWYDYKIVDGEYYCESYTEENGCGG